MKKGKPTGFSGLLLGFFGFRFFKKIYQNLNFLNWNRLVFGEPKKPYWAGFVGFRQYLNPWSGLRTLHINIKIPVFEFQAV
jgi:hypothetical protein